MAAAFWKIKQGNSAATLWLLLHTIALCYSSSQSDTASATGLFTQPCIAHWAMLSSQQNRPGERDFHVRLAFTSGHKDPPMLDNGPSSDQPSSTLIGLTVRLMPSGEDTRQEQPGSAEPAPEMTIHMSGIELSRSVERSLSVTVPERGSVTVWQLVAAAGEGENRRRYGFENTAVTSGTLAPPTRVTACTAAYRTRALISEDTLVRLKNVATGKYLMMSLKKGWEAGTLGYSKEFKYRLIGLGASAGLRIEAETHVFGGYKYAYASLFGRIYFDVLKPDSDAQLWTLSNPYPRDSDSVVIKNVRWPFAALVHNNRSTTDSVYCMYSRNPDRWILEVA